MRKIKHFTGILLIAFMASGCLGTRYLKDDQKILYKQSVKSNVRKLDTTPLSNLYIAQANQRLLGLPINHLVWMHHVGEKKFKPEKFERKKEKKENSFDRKMKKAGRQKTINNLQYRRLKKVQALDNKIENGNNLMQWGEKISVFDSLTTQLTSEKINDYLFANGYFLSEVTFTLSEKRRRVRVVYTVKPGPVYKLDSILYHIPDSTIATLIHETLTNSSLKKGLPYKQETFSSERDRIDALLRDKGYYGFNKQYTDFQIDTTLIQPHKVAVRENIRKPEKGDHHQYKINTLNFTPDVGVKADSGEVRTHGYYRKIRFHTLNDQYHKKVLRQRVFIFEDSLYSRSQTFLTQRQLANLDIFKFVNINYDTTDGKFVANIFASPLDRYSWGNEAGVSVTQGFPGPYYSLNFKKRNLFGGLEIFELNGRFGYEGVASATSIGNFYTSTEANANASISFPQFLLPLNGTQATKLAQYNPRSKILVGYTYTNRPEYQRSIITALSSYTWENKKNRQYSFTPVNLNIIKSDTSANFGALLRNLEQNGNRLINAFKPSLVSSMTFAVTWNQHDYGKANTNSFFMRASLESGGTFLNFWKPTLIENEGLQPFQFLRASLDMRRNQVLGKNSQVAFRFNSGIGYAYSANKVLPYEKNFFVGGSNSVRAWRPRRLGQGTKPPNLSVNPVADGLYDYRFEKPGDVLLEGSVELRQKLFGFVNYALFLDVGNVWSLSSDSDPQTKFEGNKFFNEFGVGTGFGLRFDFTFLILRLDAGLKAYDPGRPDGNRFVLDKIKFFKPFGTEREPVIYNIGIGYPF